MKSRSRFPWRVVRMKLKRELPIFSSRLALHPAPRYATHREALQEGGCGPYKEIHILETTKYNHVYCILSFYAAHQLQVRPLVRATRAQEVAWQVRGETHPM